MLPKSLCAVLVLIGSAACANTPHHLTVENVSDEELQIESVSASEFLYRPPVGTLGRGHSSSLEAVEGEPSQVTVTERDKPSVTVPVPPLPDDAHGEITLYVTYARSKRWTSAWEIIPERDANRVPVGTRRVPDDSDPRFRLYRALMTAVEKNDVAEVDRLLGQEAPLEWDTISDSPLSRAAGWDRTAALERLLRDDAARFALPDIEEAVFRAADPSDTDISTLRLLIEKYGTRLRPAARARALKKAAESRTESYRTTTAAPAVRYLIDEAGFDANMPVTADGQTVLTIAARETAPWRDDALVRFLETHRK